MKVDPETMRATAIDRLTTGPGPDAAVAVSTDGRRLAFTAKSQRIRTWLFPFDATRGHITGSGEAITSPGRLSVEPNLSRDGTKVAFFVPHGESLGLAYGDVRNEVWVKSLVDGSEVPVISDDYSRWTNPRLRGGFAGPVTSSGPSGRRENRKCLETTLQPDGFDHRSGTAHRE